MRIFVLGATGHIGNEVVEQALGRGHRVTAFVRSPAKMARLEGLTVVGGDPKDTDALAAAMPGHDAVVSTIGPRIKEAFRPSTLQTDCAAATVAAMTRAGVARLAIVSAAVLFPEKGLKFAFFRWLLKHHVRDLTTMEAVVTGSPLAWTIARPPRLVASEETTYQAVHEALPKNAFYASFRAVGAYLLDTLTSTNDVGHIVGVAR